MSHNDEVDRILDQALGEYRDAEPLRGIEDRILRRVAGQPVERPRRMAWILALAAAAALIISVVWLGIRSKEHSRPVANHTTQSEQQATAQAPQVEKPVAKSSAQARAEAKAGTKVPARASVTTAHIAASAPAKPGLAQFPAPAPLTGEEHALLAVARTHPDVLLGAADSPDRLNIAPIEIKPLAPEAGPPQGEQ